MKKLLVLTDFTPNASHAEAASLRLARKLNAGLVLYHAVPYVPFIPSDDGGPYVTETAVFLLDESIRRLNNEAFNLKKMALRMPGYHAHIDCRSDEGSLGDLIGELCNDTDVEMVVMGGRTGRALDHLFNGSDTATVIAKATKPVMVIPAGADWDLPMRVVFATNFADADVAALSFLMKLSGPIGFQLYIVHVLYEGDLITETGPEIAFRKWLTRHDLKCSEVFAQNVHDGLQQYCEAHGADVLAMTHGNHSFISRIFGRSESRAALSNEQLSAIIFPPAFG